MAKLSKVDQNCYVDLPLPEVQGNRLLLEVKLLDAACISAAGGMELRGSFLIQYALVAATEFHYVSTLVLDESEAEPGAKPSAVLRMLRGGRRFGIWARSIMPQ